MQNLLRRSELRVSARGLSDAFIKELPATLVSLYTKRITADSTVEWKEIGRTEIISASRNPDYQIAFELDHYIGHETTLKFAVMSLPVNHTRSSRREIEVGCLEIESYEISQLNGSITRSLTLPNSTKTKQGILRICAEEAIPHSGTIVKMQFQASGLERKELMRKNDVFYTISRIQVDSSYMLVYRSDALQKTLDPVWPLIEIDKSTLCGEQNDRDIKIEVHHARKDKTSELIGSCSTTFYEIVNKRGDLYFELVNDKARISRGGQKSGVLLNYKNSGMFRISEVQVNVQANFLEHFVSGLSLDFTVAIDFSSSSVQLHKLQESLYWQALNKIGKNCFDVLDNEQEFPIFAFGALPPTSLTTKDLSTDLYPGCISLNQAIQPDFNGTLGAFEEAAATLQKQDATNVADFISQIYKTTQKRTESDSQGDFYSILIILTGMTLDLLIKLDGKISDFEEACKIMATASELPLSVVFLGIGNSSTSFKQFADFNSDSPFEGSERSNVSFLEFREIKNLDFSQALLHRVPEQCLKYMDHNEITPRQIDSSPEEKQAAMSLLAKYDILFGDSDNILKALASAKVQADEPNTMNIFTRMSTTAPPSKYTSPVRKQIDGGTNAAAKRRSVIWKLDNAIPLFKVWDENEKPATITESPSPPAHRSNITPPDSPDGKPWMTADIGSGSDLSKSFRTKISSTMDAILAKVNKNDKGNKEIQKSLDDIVGTLGRIDRRLKRIEDTMGMK